MRPLEALRRKLAKTTSGPGRSGVYSYRASRKRQTSQHDSTSSKYGRTTVESYTIGVQQTTSEGILSNSSSTVETNNEDDESDSESLIIPAKKPRSLRVSLTLPPSIDTSPVSSTTQRSPPNVQPSWQEAGRAPLDASESSPEPMLQIKVEESENEEGGESTGSPLAAATSASSLEQQKDTLATSEAGPPSLNSTVLPPPLVDLESSNRRETENSSQDKTSNEDVLVLSSSSSSLEAAAPSEPVSTAQNSSPEPDVIIIDDDSTSRKRRTSSSSTNSTSVITNKSTAETKTPTPSLPAPDRSLVKIVPGVTSLMPSKHRRASVIHTPSPVSTPSPLEQLQMQVQAQLNRNNVYTYGGRRNSYHGSSSSSRAVTTSISSPAAATTAPLSHLNEESTSNGSSNTPSQSQKYPDKISTSTSKNTSVSVQVHGKESPTAINNAGKTTTKTNVDRTFSKEVITNTRSRKPLAPPMHVSVSPSNYCVCL